ncbi:transglycosylase family protein [Streptomyces sp. JV176]|uniref:transglycosylase family protein n=1 Tax=Streptomyces sp. JV176 TaxID=858630 RepID=UPI002E78D23E|nr:transglycosylase family protein [Streptomyces sp. JV176]MEE1799106.1 transglycosylase family protein [Streptomyces sp. JV176]
MSRNGRHRRPRQAPALLVAAGVAGSAIAIPLLGAGAANAADGSTWDHVAECESGGAWSADLRNGYYGGLQMSQETWDEFGGADYAARPDLASRSQQIAVAEKVFEAQGAQAWSSCAGVSGLTKAVGGAVSGVVEGVTGGGESTDPSGTPSTDPSGSTSPSADGTTGKGESAGTEQDGDGYPDATSPSPGATGSATGEDDADGKGGTSKGKHRGQAADESATPGGTTEERGADSRASRGAGSTRDAGKLTEGVEREVERVVTAVGGHLSLATGGQKVVGGWV